MSGSDSTGGENQSGVLKRLLAVDSKYPEYLFITALFLFFAVLLGMTPRYDPDTRLFPLVIGVPTILMIALLWLFRFSDRLQMPTESDSTSEIFDVDEGVQGQSKSDQDDEPSLPMQRKRVANIALWTLLLFGLILLVGFLPGTLVFLVAYYRWQAGREWAQTLLYSIVIWVLVIAVFDVLLGISFYEGLLGIRISFSALALL